MTKLIVGLDVESTGTNPHTDKVTAVGLSRLNNGIVHIDVYDLFYADMRDKFINAMQSFMKQDAVFVMHYSKFDRAMLLTNFGLRLNDVHCTYLASQIINNGLAIKHSYKSVIESSPYATYPFGVENSKHCVENRIFYAKTPIIAKTDVDEAGVSIQLGFTGKAPLSEAQIGYLKADVEWLPYLYQHQMMLIRNMNKAAGAKLENITNLENKLTAVLIDIELQGILVDTNVIKGFIAKWEAEEKEQVDNAYKEIIKLSETHRHLLARRSDGTKVKPALVTNSLLGVEINFNLNSSNELKDLFYRFKVIIPINENGKEAVDIAMVAKYVKENKDAPLVPFLKRFQAIKKVRKLLSTYGNKFLASLRYDCMNKHYLTDTNYKQIATTGRLKSSGVTWKSTKAVEKDLSPIQLIEYVKDMFNNVEKNKYYVELRDRHIITHTNTKAGMNIQNVPNTNLRDMFIAPNGYSFCSRDAAGIEARFAADLSKDELLCSSFLDSSIDIHSMLGTTTYRILFSDKLLTLVNDEKKIYKYKDKYDTVIEFNHAKQLRKLHKNLLYGYFYGATPTRFGAVLTSVLNVITESPENRTKLCKAVHKAMGDSMPNLRNMLKEYANKAENDGYVVGKFGRIRMFYTSKGYVAGEASNFPIQNLNAEAIKIALIKIHEFFTALNDFYTEVDFNIDGKYVVDMLNAKVKVAYIVNTVHDEINYVIHNDIQPTIEPIVQALFVGAFAFFMRKAGQSVDKEFILEVNGKMFTHKYKAYNTIIPVESSLNVSTHWVH